MSETSEPSAPESAPPTFFADVAVRAHIFNHREAIYTYAVPPALRSSLDVGMLVWIPLRRERVQGIVLSLREQPRPAAVGDNVPPSASFTIRPIDDLGDPEVCLPRAQIALARWLSEYYCAPLWDALALFLPPGVTQESVVTWRILPAGREAELGALPAGERELLYFLRRRDEASEAELDEELRGSIAELRRLAAALAERGLITRGTTVTRAGARVRRRRVARLLLAAEHQPGALAATMRAPRQRAALETLLARSARVPAGELLPAGDLPLATLRALEARGWLALEAVEALRNPLDGSTIERDMPPELTERQARALQPIVAALDRHEHQIFLLHGVTGSGKTELYLRSIARALREGRQALVLVPEIALTAQLVRRFAARFGAAVAILHSGLSLGERYDTWRRLRRREARIVVGSRSTVFAPLPELGLVIVDEEHDGSYKHADGVRYEARDVAVRLGALTGSVVLLGSATPSLESYQAALDGRYRLLELPERVTLRRGAGSHPIPLPPVRIVDMRDELRAGNRSLFSRALQHALGQTLAAQQQAILFLNRRGLASIVLCRDCGYVASCVRCSSPLVLHNVQVSTPAKAVETPSPFDTIMRCHTCGYRELPPIQCPQCWSVRIRHFGVGTQRVVEETEALFPDARVLRWDRDVTGRKGSHDRLLDAFTNHEADVIVGTQMIAKGLDLPLVTLVGIVSADIGLHLPDFRSGERTFQLLAQVAGRAGRRDIGGRVVLQTYTPDHYALRAAAAHDYHTFFGEEIAFRRSAHYPPFGQLVRLVTSSTSTARARASAEELARRIDGEIRAQGLVDANVIGPAAAFLERVRSRYRWHLLVRAPDVHPILEALGPLPGWIVDVDPVSML